MLMKMFKPLMKLLKKSMGSMNLNILVQMLLVLYSSVLVPRLPAIVMKLFNNTFVKLIIMSMIAFVSTKDMKVALMMSLALIVTLNYINKLRTVSSPKGLLHAVIDAPQEVLNKVTDDAQDVKNMGIEEVSGLTGPLKPLIKTANAIVDTVVDTTQSLTNNVIDTVQEAALGKLEPYNNDNMELMTNL